MKAADKALNYLGRAPKTKKQIEDYLKDKGYEESEILDAVKMLEEYHYIDDLKYASMFIELGYEKGRGTDRIMRELAARGIDRDTARQALDELENVPDMYEMALEIGRNTVDTALQRDAAGRLSGMDYDEIRKLQAKVARKLAGRGFTGDIVYKVAREVTKHE